LVFACGELLGGVVALIVSDFLMQCFFLEGDPSLHWLLLPLFFLALD